MNALRALQEALKVLQEALEDTWVSLGNSNICRSTLRETWDTLCL